MKEWKHPQRFMIIDRGSVNADVFRRVALEGVHSSRESAI
jgi:hypothetical protein